ncbi:sensor histidine kinase [Duganella radicis]|uniref:histidine kinase n=1 Tax=Duganella radicis TaxID=551988 RepID=A0A6L6PPX2_9BURK|nr:ATP-binding protein [Duganella radicis]MTV41168.1 HAMP domain-containing protein [Duganella radicis]
MGRLFWKFFLSILLAQLAATVGIGGAIWLKSRNQQNSPVSLDTSPPAEIAINAAAATLEFGGVKALTRMLENMERHRVYAVDEQGHELLGRSVNQRTLQESRTRLKEEGRRRAVRQVAGDDGKRYLLFLPSGERQRGLEGDNRQLLANLGGGEMGGDRPWGPRFQPLGPWVPIAAATLASLLFAVLLAWYFSRPIRALRQAFDAAANGDLAPRFAKDSNKVGNELNDLGRDFDRMTARLRSLIDGQTRLLHDVSHELRSPLARLQAAIGLAHQQPEKWSASMERIERESVRMDKLVGELLTLARLEAGAIKASQEEISMADLLDQIADDARYEAASQQRDVVQEGEADVQVIGQADLLGRAIENVVRNAIKHSPEGGEVQLQARSLPESSQLIIRVLDRGPGVSPADLDTIFQPFFRSSNASTEGHGLGLAIAQHVIEAHGGSIKASNRAGGGLCVEMILPVKR